jgi:ketosteroid isomerase-like protein
MDNAKRNTEEIFNHYMDAFLRRDLDDIVSDFDEKSIMITSPDKKVTGVAGIKEFYKQFLDMIEDGTTFGVKQLTIEGDVAFLQWTANAPSSSINDGVDTFMMRDGHIYAQTVNFSITPASA